MTAPSPVPSTPGDGEPTPRLIDLCCAAGGAAKGYADAGFEVVGVDVKPQPNYPYEFVQADACSVDVRWLRQFDAAHASPPCQRYSDLAKRNGNAEDWPDLIPPVRDLLRWSGLPYVIENVEGAPLVDAVTLCGTMFPPSFTVCTDRSCERCKGTGEYPTGAGYTRAWVPCGECFAGLRVIRHRLFETNWGLTAPAEHPPHPLVFTHDKRKGHYGQLDQDTAFVQVTGGGNCTVANKRAAMGVPWMTGKEANEAIPPAYTGFVGRQLMSRLQAKAVAA